MDRAERMEKRLELPLLVAALLTVPALVIEGSGSDEPWTTVGTVLNWTVWAAFLAEVWHEVLLRRVGLHQKNGGSLPQKAD